MEVTSLFVIAGDKRVRIRGKKNFLAGKMSEGKSSEIHQHITGIL